MKNDIVKLLNIIKLLLCLYFKCELKSCNFEWKKRKLMLDVKYKSKS